ncbi:MAG TPA: HAD family phosphatase [Candidatus Saccharimonadaceae bacterium]|nr:HAD family phosphatase [Candidatus Saccharimonadaceae bacterium]
MKNTSLNQKRRKFAVFDIDGTLFRDALFSEIAYELLAMGVIEEKVFAQALTQRAHYERRDHDDAFQEFMHSLAVALEQEIPRVRTADYDAAVSKVAAEKLDHVYTYTRDLANKLKEDGYFLLAISGSQYEIVEAFAKKYHFDAWVGEKWERGSKYFTGKISVTHVAKGNLLRQKIQELGLTLTGSYAVGDTMGDIELLEMVENPIAFNPNRELYNTALTRGWKIVVERKNVKYELEEGNDGSYVLARPEA